MPRSLAELFGVAEGPVKWERPLFVFTALFLPQAAVRIGTWAGSGEWPTFQLVPFSVGESAWKAAGPAIWNLALVVVATAVLRFVRRPVVALALLTLLYVPLDRLSALASLAGQLSHRGSLDLDHPVLAQTWALQSILSVALWVLAVWGGVGLALRFFERLLPALLVGLCGGQTLARVASIVLRGDAGSLAAPIEVYSLLLAQAGMLLTALLLWAALRIAVDRPSGTARGSQRLSRGLFLGSVLACGVGGNLTAEILSTALSRPVSAWSGSDLVALAVVGALLALFTVWALIAFLTLVYRMWEAIQDGHARTSPGRAVGMLFVPIYGAYWAFHVFPGFATDFNAFVDRHRLWVAKLSRGVFTAFAVVPILALLVPDPIPVAPVHLAVALVMVSRTCDAVNAALAPRPVTDPGESRA